MSDLAMSVTITRDLLGLPDLELNDFESYYIAAEMLGGSVSWNKTKAASPYVDGEVTVAMVRGLVNEKLTVEVLGDDITELTANLGEAYTAFCQNGYRLQFSLDGLILAYQCEPASLNIAWTGPRVIARQVQLVVGFDRQPQPLTGAF